MSVQGPGLAIELSSFPGPNAGLTAQLSTYPWIFLASGQRYLKAYRHKRQFQHVETCRPCTEDHMQQKQKILCLHVVRAS